MINSPEVAPVKPLWNVGRQWDFWQTHEQSHLGDVDERFAQSEGVAGGNE